jgi:hypothetical protein
MNLEKIKNTVENSKDEICLISKEVIENKITLPCSHSFEYYYLYQEIQQQIKRHRIYFKCPYCRHQYIKSTIPYYEIDEVEKITNINFNYNNVLPILKCYCGKPAHRYKIGDYCKTHFSSMNKPKCLHICKNQNQCKLFAIQEQQYCKRHSGLYLQKTE